MPKYTEEKPQKGNHFLCPALKRRFKQPNVPQTTGPFRGLLVKFSANPNYEEFINTFGRITFDHPGYQSSKTDRKKCIIYYKHPYNVANLLTQYEDNKGFKMYLYKDEISRTLHPEVLYIRTNKIPTRIEELGGQIIKQSRGSLQVKFEDFRTTAVAHEELRQNYEVKFSYRSEVPMFVNETNNAVDLREVITKNEAQASGVAVDLRDKINSKFEHSKKHEQALIDHISEQEDRHRKKIAARRTSRKIADIMKSSDASTTDSEEDEEVGEKLKKRDWKLSSWSMN